MALEAILQKKPYEVSFSKNPMPFSFALSPYGDTQKAQDIRLQVRVLVEKTSGTGVFSEVKSQTFFPDIIGTFTFDIRPILDAYLTFYTPKTTLDKAIEAAVQRRAYKVSWTLIQNGSIVSTTTSDAQYAIKGGLSYDQWHSQEFFTKKVVLDHQPLQFFAGEKVFLDDLSYFFWIYPLGDSAAQDIVYNIKTSLGTFSYSSLPSIILPKWGIGCVPSGWNQIAGLGGSLGTGEIPISYNIQIVVGSTVIAQSQEYTVDQRNFYNTSQLLFRNSLGGLQTLRLRGQIDYEADYVTQQAQRIVPPSYYQNLQLMAQVIQTGTEESPKFKGDTGFVSQGKADQFRDLFLSTDRYELVNGRLVPIIINFKTVSFYSNHDNLISLQIEWQRAYVNQSYTPPALMPTTRTCPAIEVFVIKQLSKTELQIIWALQMPYDQVHVQLTYESTTYDFYFDGNKGSERQSIVQPSGDTTITAKARTACDREASDFGAYTTISVAYIGNLLPVVTDDYYNILEGYTTPVTLSPSAMANDYDPDGDAIAVIADTGATADGGTYDIDAAGVVQYTPPSAGYTGVDSFTYQVRETPSGTPVTGTVYINVGAVITVYAKVVIRNVTGTTNQSADVWVDFFSDPAGTIPYDVTALGITTHVDHVVHSHNKTTGVDSDTTDTIDTAATGNKVLVYTGPIYTDSPHFTNVHEFTLTAGSGYTVI